MRVMRLPCVLVALERERLFLHDTYPIQKTTANASCRAFHCANASGPILIVETGVGAERTLLALDWLLGRPMLEGAVIEPSLLVFAGFAGALQTTMNVGDVIFAAEVVDLAGRKWGAALDHDPLTPNPALPKRGREEMQRGRLLTVDRFIGEPAEKLALGVQHQAQAVDMESAAFAERCSACGVPWACLRVISDDVSIPFTVEVASLVEDGRVKFGRVAALLARKPWLLPKLLRLGRQTELASRRLAEAVIQFLACSSAG